MTDTTTAAAQIVGESHRRPGGGETDPQPLPAPKASAAAVVCCGAQSPPPPSFVPTAKAGAGWDELRTWAAMLEDARHNRIAITNRIRSGTVDPDQFDDALALVHQSETHIALQLRRCFRRVVPEPIRHWQKTTHGIGEPGLSLLLGITGNPAIAEPYMWEGEGSDRHLVALEPYRRGLRQWYSYCGWGDPNRRRRKGMTATEAVGLGNQRAKTVAWNIGGAQIKHTSSPYRTVYDEAKARYQHRVDAGEDGWSQGRAHNAALRVTIKAVLRDIWEHAQ